MKRMRWAACGLAAWLVLLGSGTAGAAGAITPELEGKVLPKAEAAAGWIKLFDGETLFGWNVLGDAQWQVANGALSCSGGSGGAVMTTSQFADFELKARVRISPGASAGLVFRAGLDGHPAENGSGFLTGQMPENEPANWYPIEIRAVGDQVTVNVAGDASVFQRPDRAVGHIGFLYHGKGSFEVQSVLLRPLNLRSLFNGQDLSGWNIIPDRKSEFRVVDGSLNITNGNGQIETADVFRDFILQLDIISNGEHLNSGVFYRGPVGEFWRGYESQVRNQWEGDRTNPVDFGTGGIYGNQPARIVAATDGEWFHKTIVATGPHMAVWIDGYQVSDYTDVRPQVNDYNGKAGYVPQSGTIHLQGHDPKTDLSFKNINIQEYPDQE